MKEIKLDGSLSSSDRRFVSSSGRVIPEGFDGEAYLRFLLGIEDTSKRPILDIDTVRRDYRKGESDQSVLSYFGIEEEQESQKPPENNGEEPILPVRSLLNKLLARGGSY